MRFEKKYISHAKINLGLSVPFRYQSGYHHIVSLFSPIDFCDEIALSFTMASKNSFTLTWENLLPAGFNSLENVNTVFEVEYQNNLIYKAFQWMNSFIKESGIELPCFETRIHIKKRIPSPAGLGGGSSNAATIIFAMFEFLEASKLMSDKNTAGKLLHNLKSRCIETGSDIPFFLENLVKPQTALISGTGEVFQAFPGIKLAGILGIPPFGFSTRIMYESLKRPVFSGNYHDIMAIPDRENPQSFSKKTLHDENSLIDNQYSIHAIHNGYKSLYELLTIDDMARDSGSTGESSSRKPVYKKENGTYVLDNDFLDISQKIFPEKYKFIRKIKKDALNELLQIARQENIQSKTLCSMSGSGATIYVGVTGKEGYSPKIQQKLDFSIISLRKKHADVHWIKFCTI